MLMGEELYNYIVDMLAEKNMIHDEELIHANEVCEEVFFESVEVDSSSDEYEPEEKKRDIKHIPLNYKIKAVNMAKNHPTWSIKTLHRCQYQSTFNRTLADKGSKTIFVKQQDRNKLTHTYTDQYALTLSGKLLPKVFVCLQEPTRKFGPRVQKIVEEYSQKYKNIVITSSNSGKFSTELYIDFLQDCLKPYVEKENYSSSRRFLERSNKTRNLG
ncbi:HTH CENPB-type domain-containing protein [Trichonephila inaurata madagascariensis]|uniref:HTH CENPB-type domain-containing protein n=1 Tax=Trichonephila inaurata madagascariensis TaxID=2747483 RepID=A0A8X6WNE3_9ARAC|nr:HTH CENPB-type domain-containing protein [Trichonephila inaurata madagascariensis]